MSTRATKLTFASVWVVLCVALLAPIFAARTLPILDLPNHLALVRGWVSFDDASYHIADHYLLRLRPVPYLLFYAVCRALAAVVEIELAGKLSLALYLLAFVHGALLLALAARRTPWLALAGFPLAYGPPYSFGFVNYLYGSALLLFALAAAVAALDDERARRQRVWLAATSGLFAIAVLASHVLAWGYLGIGLGALCGHALWRDRAEWRSRFWRATAPLVAAVPSLVLFAWSVVIERRERAYFHQGAKTTYYFRPLWDLLNDLPRWILEVVPGSLDRVVLLLLLVTVLFAWMQSDEPAADRAPIARLRAIAFGWIGAYLLLPESIYQPTRIMFISHRLPVLFALVLCLAAPRPRRAWMLAPALIAALLLPLRLVPLYRDFSRRQEPFFSLLDQIPRGASVLVVPRQLLGPAPGLLTPDDPAASVPVYWHFTSWPMALRGGQSPHLFDQGIPIRPRNAPWVPPESKQVRVDLRAIIGYEYFLLYEPADPVLIPVEKIASAGRWTLYKRRGASAP